MEKKIFLIRKIRGKQTDRLGDSEIARNKRNYAKIKRNDGGIYPFRASLKLLIFLIQSW